ncbi:unnamed protein product [Arctia plantaginis]|uniref:Uncharacterized protein n=1 Tax=Arctia plantaginis TaxID=874455 RepID=A0A8S1BCJ1_ARCPL|nr:unnamed protein product [Arctia plantaginis]
MIRKEGSTLFAEQLILPPEERPKTDRACQTSLSAIAVTKVGNVTANTALLGKSVFCMAPKIYNKVPNAYKDIKVDLF